MTKRLLLVAAALALVAIVAVGLVQAGDDNGDLAGTPDSSRFATAQEAADAVQDAPASITALYEQPSALLPGATKTLRATLADLKGQPVVVNKWASWCGPCRAEFPTFQAATAELAADGVALLGLNTGDNDGDAKAFLAKYPVAYPSVLDPDAKAAVAEEMGTFFPTTAFYDARGERVFVHQGPYTSVEDLRRDVERYALDRAR